MAASTRNETEIKLRLDDNVAFAAKLAPLGFQVIHPRVLEVNVIYDTDGKDLQSRGQLIRLRSVEGRLALLTYKGKVKTDVHKSREELEISVSDFRNAELILNRLGLLPRFRYDKYRTEYGDGRGIVTVDETPIGNFAEIEGEADWIDHTAATLRVLTSDYITDSYAALFQKYCIEYGLNARDMTFPAVLDRKIP